ncbi:hypothetical protein TNCV_1773341 [Trichonephila clavipes]|nr:hypothetical protein TNCV_1773341 [Trichonephila clavipes]
MVPDASTKRDRNEIRDNQLFRNLYANCMVTAAKRRNALLDSANKIITQSYSEDIKKLRDLQEWCKMIRKR